MAANYHITPEQEAILNTYTCQRLTEDPENIWRLKDFKNKRNRLLASHLKEFAWQEDTDGLPAAYYVVKNQAGRIALFFSLKCGTLCDPSYVAKVVKNYKEIQDLMDKIENADIPYRKRQDINSQYWDASDDYNLIKNEKKEEPNRMLLRVDESYPAIELVHFCANENLRTEWKSLKLGRGMGEVFFWRFVVPKMLEIHKLIGSEYVFLFAADDSRDKTLVNYYEQALHFECPTYIAGIKPWYDFNCIFMCKQLRRLSWDRRQKLEKKFETELDPRGLEDYAKLFFETFNEKPSMVK